MSAVLYIHGKGGSAAESAHYAPLFPNRVVSGLDYRGETPWDAGKEIRQALEALRCDHDSVILIANSIGACFSLCAGIDRLIEKAFFISPIVDMERLIEDLMRAANVTEGRLQKEGVIQTDFGEPLSWDYLQFVRENPVLWNAPTEILYGQNDALVPFETVFAFAQKYHAGLTVMENGEHWFHTEEQMRFLDHWIEEH